MVPATQILLATALAPLPYPEEQALFLLSNRYPEAETIDPLFSPPAFLELAQHLDSVGTAAAIHKKRFMVGHGTGAALVLGAAVSPGLGSVLGWSVQGTGLHESCAQQAILTDSMVRALTGVGEPAPAQVTIDHQTFNVAGVVPAAEAYPPETELWVPLCFNPDSPTHNYGNRYLDVLVRVETEPYAASLQGALDNYTGSKPERSAQATGIEGRWAVEAQPLREVLLGNARKTNESLFWATALFFLAISSGVGALLLLLALGRESELRVRWLIGATKRRLAREILGESAGVTLAGLGLALPVAIALTRFLTARLLPEVFSKGDWALQPAFLLLNAVSVALVGCLASAVPAASYILGGRSGTLARWRSGTSTPGRGTIRLMYAVVLAQLILSVPVLLGATGSVTRLWQLASIDLGYQESATVFYRLVTGPEVRHQEDLRRFYSRLHELGGKIPGVESWGVTSVAPLQGRSWKLPISTESSARYPEGTIHQVNVQAASKNYFRTLGLRFVEGDEFPDDDGPNSQYAILDRNLARKLWPSQQAIGRQVKLGELTEETPWLTVVGVVESARHIELDRPSEPRIFLPFGYFPLQPVYFSLRPEPDHVIGLDDVTSASQEALGAIPIERVGTIDEEVRSAVAEPASIAAVFSSFAAIVWFTSAAGSFALFGFLLQIRKHDLSVRVALGATRRHILHLQLRLGLGISVAGVLLGFGATMLARRLLAQTALPLVELHPLSLGFVASLTLVAGVSAAGLAVARLKLDTPGLFQ